MESMEAIEAAWFERDLRLVEASAQEVLATDASDARALGWLGLVQYLGDKAATAQTTLRRAFAGLRDEEAAAADEDARHIARWAMHTFANHLIDALAVNPTLGAPAARFVVEGLGFDHAPSLRVLAEEKAGPGGDAVGASRLLKRALALDATDAESHYLVARLAARVGRAAVALKHLQKAIEYGGQLTQADTLARYEPDFDGLRGDAAFIALIDTLPADATLRPLYEALERGEPWDVLALAPAVVDATPQPLDALYPWREALELSRASGGPDVAQVEADLAAVEARIGALEAQGQSSAVYRRYLGE